MTTGAAKRYPLSDDVKARVREGVRTFEWRFHRSHRAYSVPPSWIYVIECEGFVKVGYAADPERRLADFVVASPFDVRLFSKRDVPAAYATAAERGAHYGLAEYRHRGEWFRCDPKHASKVVTAACQEVARMIRRHYTASDRAAWAARAAPLPSLPGEGVDR